ncbi:IclR family transcriptional regulator [Paraburkholderia sp. CNPSo 3076]|uniref:IclR family transcriptional regulator n=1 Tax=Paraburkholderia sp. CNPSo 3076 TaxID=2940936 RepID=UPI002250B669|nr:IclR family transcriptional regulator [Paraburkholderia sp. CNPSo 3076]MCX5543056.1 IclR family transcriptional regulator [Paraburkholderia sp. CNPSo 3076]
MAHPPEDREAGIQSTASPGPRATTRIVQVLRILADHPQGATLTELADLSATPKTSLLALLRALTHAHYLTHDGGKYALGVEAFKLGAAIVAQRRFPEIARPVMERLALEAGETILIGQLASDRPSMVYVMSAESRSAIRFIAGIGERRELFSSSGGRVLLAAMSEAQQTEYFRTAEMRAHTPATRTQKRELKALIKEVADTGVAATVEQSSADVVGFAAPIRDESGAVIAALVMGTPVSRGVPGMERFKALIARGAAEVSALLGYAGSTTLAFSKPQR